MQPTNAAAPKLAFKATLAGAAVSPVHKSFGWDLPTQNADGTWTPGKWASVKGLVRYRRNGLHVCAAKQLAFWFGHLKGREMQTWICEYDGHTNAGRWGFAARRVRLLRPWDGVEAI